MSWDGFLNETELQRLAAFLVVAGFDDPLKRAVLRRALPRAFAGTLGGDTMAPEPQLLHQMRQMNAIYSLDGGERPLEIFLEEARDIVGAASHAEILQAYLDKIAGEEAMPPGFNAAPSVAPEFELAAAGADSAGEGDFLSVANIEMTEEALTNDLDETVGVSFLQQGAQASLSVVKIVVKKFFDGEQVFWMPDRPTLEKGTGWVIAPGLLVTNHHVIDARAVRRGEDMASEADLRLQAARSEILFDYIAPDGAVSGIEAGEGALLAWSPRTELDYAILRLPQAAPQRAPLRLTRTAMRKRIAQALGSRVNVLQHPGGKPMRLGFRNNYVVIGDENALAYLTDTRGGSSGSPVFDDQWRVVALHRGARGVSKQGIEIMGKLIRLENYGTAMPRIMADLEQRFPDVHAEIVAGQSALS